MELSFIRLCEFADPWIARLSSMLMIYGVPLTFWINSSMVLGGKLFFTIIFLAVTMLPFWNDLRFRPNNRLMNDFASFRIINHVLRVEIQDSVWGNSVVIPFYSHFFCFSLSVSTILVESSTNRHLHMSPTNQVAFSTRFFGFLCSTNMGSNEEPINIPKFWRHKIICML